MDVKLKKWPEVEVGNGTDQWRNSETSVLFEVRKDSGKLHGRFQVSRGGIRWWKGAAKSKPTRHLKWSELVDFLEE